MAVHTATKVGIGLVVAALLAAMALASAPSAGAQQNANVGRLTSGLIAVNVQNINVEDFQVVNVEDSLNENEIRILNNVLNNNEVLSRNQNFLNNLLRDAEILNENQVVVGVNVLGGQLIVLEQ